MITPTPEVLEAYVQRGGALVSYYDEVGRITANAMLQPEVVEMLREERGERLADGWFETATHYVVDGAAIARPVNPAHLVGMTLQGLPVPCTVVIDDTSYPCTEATAELTFPYAGTFRVQVEAWPMQTAQFEVTV